jgi:hypothetical protein
MSVIEYEIGSNKPTIQYDVVFGIRGNRRTVSVKVPDAKDENTNKTRAVTAAAMALDSEGITVWSLLGCAKATS